MSGSTINKTFGREAFGLDPAGYHASRPGYPDWVYETLCQRCELRSNTATFEIGAGTGIATRRLLELGANPLMAIEPDNRLADFLRETIQHQALNVIRGTFEDAILSEAAFDLGFCATAFHWLDEKAALAKVANLLKPGAWWAAVWNVFGDPGRPDAFHEATTLLLNGPMGPSGDDRNIPFALDKEARLAALDQADAFEDIGYQTGEWSLILDPGQTVSVYATYSNINIRPDRETILAELGRIARDEFHGRVTRNMTTILYVARRRSAGTGHMLY